MSKTQMLYLPCPKCGKYSQHLAYSSLNEANPDSYKSIINDEINFAKCASCTHKFQIETGLLYCNHSSAFAVYYHPHNFKELELTHEGIVRMLGKGSHLANPHKFTDWSRFKETILRLEQSKKPITAPSARAAGPETIHPEIKPKKSIFGFIKGLFFKDNESKEAPKEAQKPKAQVPVRTHVTIPDVPPRPVVEPVPSALPPPATLSILKQIDARSHKLTINIVTGLSTEKNIILVTVTISPYSVLIHGAKKEGTTTHPFSKTLHGFVLRVLPRPQYLTPPLYSVTHFGSESEYAEFLKKHCPELPAASCSEWFETVGYHIQWSSIPYWQNRFALEFIEFIKQQSTAYSARHAVEVAERAAAKRAIITVPRETVPEKPQPKPLPSPVTVCEEAIEEGATKKPDWIEFQQLLQTHNITKLYHFTDRSNLSSILSSGGLLSWYSCKQKGLSIPRPGGSELSWQLDTGKGLADYVRLSFVRDHPMGYVAKQDGRITSEVILEIDPEVIFWESTKFSTMNATKKGVSANGTLEKLASMKFNVFRRRYFDLTDEEKPYYQAEVLVHQMLPLKYITNLDKLKKLV